MKQFVRWTIMGACLALVIFLYSRSDSGYDTIIEQFKKEITGQNKVLHVEKEKVESKTTSAKLIPNKVIQTNLKQTFLSLLPPAIDARKLVTLTSSQAIFSEDKPLLALNHGIFEIDNKIKITPHPGRNYYIQFPKLPNSGSELFAKLALTDIQIKAYIHPRTWLIKPTTELAAQRLGTLEIEHVLSRVDVRDKIEPSILQRPIRPKDSGDLFWLQLENANQVPIVKELVGELGGRVVSSPSPHILSVNLSLRSLAQLAELEQVDWIQPQPEPSELTAMHHTKETTAVDSKNIQLTGKDLIIGLWDGMDAKQLELASVTDQASIHAYFMRSMIKGSQTEQLHMNAIAPNATIKLFNGMNLIDTLKATAKNIADENIDIAIHNHAESVDCKSILNQPMYVKKKLAYNLTHQLWDAMIRQQPHILFHAMGNMHDCAELYREQSEHNLLFSQSLAFAKNVIAIKGLEQAALVNKIHTFNKQSDLLYGVIQARVRPDLVVSEALPETELNQYLCVEKNTSSICQFKGSSVANTRAGAEAALISERFKQQFGYLPQAAEFKSLLIQTAIDVEPLGPDLNTGWGIMNQVKAFEQIAEGEANKQIIKIGPEQSLAQYYINVSEFDDNLKLTASWLDVPGYPGALFSLNNDIDLKLISPSGTIVKSWTLQSKENEFVAIRADNHVDNVEQLFVSYPEPGKWELQVSGYHLEDKAVDVFVYSSAPFISHEN